MAIELKGEQETLLIPLLARAKETKADHPRIKDKYAVEMINKLNCDWSRYEGNSSWQGVIARTMILDKETQKFADEYFLYALTLCFY